MVVVDVCVLFYVSIRQPTSVNADYSKNDPKLSK